MLTSNPRCANYSRRKIRAACYFICFRKYKIVYRCCIPNSIVISFSSVQDVAARIMAFSQQGPRAVCIISATGAVSTATLHQDSDSGGVVTYEVCWCWLPFLPTRACVCLVLSLVVHLNTLISPLCKLNDVLAAGNWLHSLIASMSDLKLLLLFQILSLFWKCLIATPKHWTRFQVCSAGS